MALLIILLVVIVLSIAPVYLSCEEIMYLVKFFVREPQTTQEEREPMGFKMRQ